MSKPKAWTPERAREWRREYKRRTRQNPTIRARDNRIARESAARTREFRRYQHWGKFPYGYQAPPGLEGHALFIDFQSFIESIILPGNGTLSAFYWRHRFDPRCPDASQRWNAIVAEVQAIDPNSDPLKPFKDRANRLITNSQKLPSGTLSQYVDPSTEFTL